MMQKSSDISIFSSNQLHGQYPSNFFEPEAVRERAAAASAVLFPLLLVSAATVKKDYFLCDHQCDPWSRTSYNSREMSVVEFGYSEHSLNSSRRKFRQLAGNAALKSPSLKSPSAQCLQPRSDVSTNAASESQRRMVECRHDDARCGARVRNESSCEAPLRRLE